MSVDAVVGDIKSRALEPFRVGGGEITAAHMTPWLMPMQQAASLFGPEFLGVFDRLGVHRLVLSLVEMALSGGLFCHGIALAARHRKGFQGRRRA